MSGVLESRKEGSALPPSYRIGSRVADQMRTPGFLLIQQRGFIYWVALLFAGMLSVVILSSPVMAVSTWNGSPSGQNTFLALDKADVSVVRVVSMYKSSPSSIGEDLFCTGLGTIVGNWTPQQKNAQDFNTWVLTSGALVDLAHPICKSDATDAQLVGVQVYTSAAYGPVSHSPFIFDGRTPKFPKGIKFSDTQTSGGMALVPFHSETLQPFVSLASQNTTQSQRVLLGQGVQNTKVPDPGLNTVLDSTHYLDISTARSAQAAEVGMPLVDSNGRLLHFEKGDKTFFSLDEIRAFFTDQSALELIYPSSAHLNVLQSSWDRGISEYYNQNYHQAQVDFQQAARLNPDFRAAAVYADQANQLALRNRNIESERSVNTIPASPITFMGIPLWILSIVGLVVLVLILILLSILIGRIFRNRRELAKFRAEAAEAHRMVEEQQRARRNQIVDKKSDSDVRLHAVRSNGNSTPLRAVTPMIEQLSPQPPRPPMPPALSYTTPSSPPPMVAVPFVSEQPTREFPLSPEPPTLVDTPTYPMSSEPPTLIDAPAQQLSPEPPTVVNVSANQEDTQPYSLKQMKKANLSLVVGTQTDPGIKRKHKPNEDSLFAARGAREHASAPEQFGLFVVADGMGGHANGQNASRLAIQTIVNMLLPQICGQPPQNEEAYRELLASGVQSANEAVYNRNQEERADMGTTMTAVLIEGSMAFIANVGDSRTYLYHPPDGLRKITTDHSVVASLVEAGIIKPDDIYTHPKRHQIYRSLGEKLEIEIDTFTVQLQLGDKLLLCSDGLWDMVRDPRIQDVLSQPSPDPYQTGDALVKAAFDGGGEDNVSVIVISITEETQKTGKVGIQILDKPETVTIPPM